MERKRQAGSQDFNPALGDCRADPVSGEDTVCETHVELRVQEENPALITSLAFYVHKLSCGKTCSCVETALTS